MSILATFLPRSGTLSSFGDAVANAVTFSRNAVGAILVNGGAIAMAGGNPAFADTMRIQAFRQAGDDGLTLDEAIGAWPAALLFGGAGNDVIQGRWWFMNAPFAA